MNGVPLGRTPVRPSRRDLLRMGGLGAAALAMSGLSGCRADSGSGGSGGGAANLSLMFWGDQNAGQAMRRLTDVFRKADHENVTFDFIHQPTEYETKLQTLIAASKAPDLFGLNTNNLLRFAEQGALLDLQPHFEALGLDVENEFVPLGIHKYQGATVGIGGGIGCIVMYYDRAAFDAAGVPYPPTDPAAAWTWEEFRQAAKELSGGEGTNATWGAYMAPWMTVWTPLVYSNGGSWWNDDVTAFTLDTPEVAEVLKDIRDMRDEGSAVGTKALGAIGFDVILQSRRAAMFLDGTWNDGVVREAWGDDAGIALLPVYDKFTSMAVADPMVAFSGTSEPELAAEYIRFVADPSMNPDVLDGTPTSRRYLEGDEQDTWLKASPRPDGYADTVFNSVEHAIRNPGSAALAMPQIEFPLVMEKAVIPYLAGDIDDIQEAMAAIKPDVDRLLNA
jgi:multiple sugar transport system substrate-binding protein